MKMRRVRSHRRVKDFWSHKLPLILGWDLSGAVEAVGPGPAPAGRFKKGDEVYSVSDISRDGAYAEYVVVRESELSLKPKSLHHVRAAAMPLAALTAWQALFDTGQLVSGQRILIHGGSGGVGHVAVQLAKWKGGHVFGTASTENQELLRELGVDEPIDYTKQKFEDVARDVDLVLDLIGGETQERSWSVLKNGGVLLSLVQPPSVEIAKLIDSGELKLTIDRILPLSEVRRAHELSQSGHTRGKIVLRVKE